MHLQQRRLVVRHIGPHGPDHTAVVNHAGKIRQGLADFDAALAGLMELEGRGHEAGPFILPVKLAAGLLAFVSFERGLGIERVDVRRPAIEEKENDAPGARREVRLARGAGE